MDSPCPLIPQARSLLFGTQGCVAFVLGPQIASVKRPPPSGQGSRPGCLVEVQALLMELHHGVHGLGGPLVPVWSSRGHLGLVQTFLTLAPSNELSEPPWRAADGGPCGVGGLGLPRSLSLAEGSQSLCVLKSPGSF